MPRMPWQPGRLGRKKPLGGAKGRGGWGKGVSFVAGEESAGIPPFEFNCVNAPHLRYGPTMTLEPHKGVSALTAP
jgi:hypothetical protein